MPSFGERLGIKPRVKGLPLMLVNSIEEKQALLRNLLKHPLTTAKVAEAVYRQFVLFNPALTVFAVQKAKMEDKQC